MALVAARPTGIHKPGERVIQPPPWSEAEAYYRPPCFTSASTARKYIYYLVNGAFRSERPCRLRNSFGSINLTAGSISRPRSEQAWDMAKGTACSPSLDCSWQSLLQQRFRQEPTGSEWCEVTLSWGGSPSFFLSFPNAFVLAKTALVVPPLRVAQVYRRIKVFQLVFRTILQFVNCPKTYPFSWPKAAPPMVQ